MNPQSASPGKVKKLPKWLKIVLIIIAALIIFVAAVLLITEQATKNAVKVSNQFVTDVQTDNTTAAYSLTSPAFKQATSQAKLTQIIDGVSPALQGTLSVTNKAISKTSGQPDQATINYTVKTSSGTKYIKVILQDNNPWQLISFDSSPTPID